MTDYEAWQPWIPRLVDIEKRKADEVPGYSNVGFSALVIPADCTEISDRSAELAQRFNERYAFRMINAETLERWQLRLQNRLDEIVHRYNRAYELYDEYETEINEMGLEGWTETSKSTDSGNETLNFLGSEELAYTGSQKTTEGGHDDTEALRSDTPDSAINAGGAYADLTQTGKTTYGHTSEDTFTDRKDTRSFADRKDKRDFGEIIDKEITRIITGPSVVEDINASIKNWEDIDTRFVAEFENLFLNVFWY